MQTTVKLQKMFNLRHIEGKQIVTTTKWSIFMYPITKTASAIIMATTVITWYCGGYEEPDTPVESSLETAKIFNATFWSHN